MLKILVLSAFVAAAAAAYPPIQDIAQTDSTLTSVTLSWTLDVSEFTPDIYTLHIDNILTMQFFYDDSNTYTAEGLQACKEYSFALNANYGDEAGPATETTGSTLYEVPGSVEDLALDNNVITWTPPANDRCVEHYNVCYQSAVTGYGNCVEVTDPYYDLGQISGCDDVRIQVTGVGGGLEGPPSETRVETEYMTPGKPRNYEVTIISETEVQLAWDAPLENPACVTDFSIVYGPADNATAAITTVVSTHRGDESDDDDQEDDLDREIRTGPSGQEFTAVLDNLQPCTEYRFALSTLSEQGEYSEQVVQNRATLGVAPGEVPDITFDQDTDSITIAWGDVSEEICLNFIQICYSDPIEITTKCFEVPTNPNHWTLNGLKACREYDFVIRGLSPDGQNGPPKFISVTTKDVVPGPVRDMFLGSIGVTSLTVTYTDPLNYAECVDQYVITYKNLMEKEATTQKLAATRSTFTDQINGLDACAEYEVGVYAVSVSGYEGNITTRQSALQQATPDPPISGTMLTSTDNTATLLWYAPQETRYCVNEYRVKINQPGGGPGVSETVLVEDYNEEVLHTFSGLSPCTGYVAEMRSRNTPSNTESDFVQVVTDIMTTC